MESTPSLDADIGITPSHTPAAMSFPPSTSSSTAQNAQAADQPSTNGSAAQSSSSQHKYSNGPHIRSRITVVCAECKRLKLKCDRRTPCSSCLKRDTVQRCIYSQAAAEKVDVQTLHNRIIEIERILVQLQSAPASMPVSAALTGITSLKQPAAVAGPSRAGHSITPSTSSLMAGWPCNDRALLAQGASGSSVVINYDDVVSLWLNELDDLGFDPKSPQSSGADINSSPMRPSASTVKLEPASVSIPPASTSFSPATGSYPSTGGLHALHPPAPYDAFLPPPSAGPSALPQVTADVVGYLPSEPVRSRFLKAFRETMLLHPSFNVPHFEQRISAIYTWAENGEATSSSLVTAYGNKPMSKQELARDIFFSTAKPGSSSSLTRGSGTASAHSSSNAPKPTLSFFAAASAAFALGSLVSRNEEPSSPTSTSTGGSGDASGTPAMLFALSEQALQLFEKTAAYDLDSVIAMILQVLYMLHEGQMSIAQSVFPLVGKMVNVARQMGLSMDPDEFLGTYNLFEAETRRRIWWDVCFYDLFVSDSMGQPPLIADNSHTTRLASDVDEEKFTPSCTSLPVPETAEGDSSSSSTYFGLKCRIAQLVKNIKKQTFRDPVPDESIELSIDQAGALEGEVKAFLQDLPAGFGLEMTQDISKPIPPPTGSPIRLAQKCELAVIANRVIVKLYLPFLKEAALTHKPAHQAVFGTIDAAHNIVYASRLLHLVWGQTRPAMFDFYDFGRTLFDAGVVCAHTVIQEPMSIVASEGMKSLACATDILKEIGSSRLGVEGARADKTGAGSRSEAVRILEWMKARAEAARGGSCVAGTKRKHSVIEPEPLASSTSFQLPFVGAAVNSSKTERSRATVARAATILAVKDGEAKSSKSEAKKQVKDKDKDKDKDRTPKYLNGPLRVRPMTGQPAPRRQRTASVSTTTAGNSRVAPPPISPLMTNPLSAGGIPSSSSSSSSAQVQPSSSRPSVSVPQSPSMPTAYETYPSSRMSVAPEPMGQQQQQDDYGMQYSSPDGSLSDDRRFSGHSSYDSPQSTTMYDPQPQAPQYAQPSPAPSYPPPSAQAQAGYYLPYSASASGYDGHLQMSIVDTTGAAGGTVTSGMTTLGHEQQQQQQQHYMPQDAGKGHHGYHARGMEYPTPVSSHGHGHPHSHPHSQHHAQAQAMATLPPQHVQAAWGTAAQGEGPEMWPEYKFYGGIAG